MSDKLTAIKIKQSDNPLVYSDEIPIKVLAENVIWNIDGNQYNLEDVIGEFNSNQSSIKTQLQNKVSYTALDSYIENNLQEDIVTWLGSHYVIDADLDSSNQAADAKATGDAIRANTASIQGLSDSIDNKVTWNTATYERPYIKRGTGDNSIIENGTDSVTEGDYSHCQGNQNSISQNGNYSHCEGSNNQIQSENAHCQGNQNLIAQNSDYSHVEGFNNQIRGECTHVEGQYNIASGSIAHAQGDQVRASGTCSHAQGSGTIANHDSQHVFGQFNIADDSNTEPTERGNYVEIVGNGTADNARSNIRTLDWNGNETLTGKLTIGAHPSNNMDVTTKQYVDQKINSTKEYIDQSIADTEVGLIENRIDTLETDMANINSNVTSGDENKVLSPKTIENGKVTEWQFNTVNYDGVSDYMVLNNRPAIQQGEGTNATLENNATTASGLNSHAEGSETSASNNNAHAEGEHTIASGIDSHAEGFNTIAIGDYSHTEGYETKTYNIFDPQHKGIYGHAEGRNTFAYGIASHAEGFQSRAAGDYSHAEGAPYQLQQQSQWSRPSTAQGYASHAQGKGLASGDYSHAQGGGRALGIFSHAEGADGLDGPEARGYGSHAQGEAIAVGYLSHAQSSGSTRGQFSHAQGSSSARGDFSHAEGITTIAEGDSSHAEGNLTKAKGDNSHAAGYHSQAIGNQSTAIGSFTFAFGEDSVAMGRETVALNDENTVIGRYNKATQTSLDTFIDTGDYPFIIGNGTSNQRSNAFTVDWEGNVEASGKIRDSSGALGVKVAHHAFSITITGNSGSSRNSTGSFSLSAAESSGYLTTIITQIWPASTWDNANATVARIEKIENAVDVTLVAMVPQEYLIVADVLYRG